MTSTTCTIVVEHTVVILEPTAWILWKILSIFSNFLVKDFSLVFILQLLCLWFWNIENIILFKFPVYNKTTVASMQTHHYRFHGKWPFQTVTLSLWYSGNVELGSWWKWSLETVPVLWQRFASRDSSRHSSGKHLTPFFEISAQESGIPPCSGWPRSWKQLENWKFY